MLPLVHQVVHSLTDIAAAIMKTGVRTHAGNLVLAKVTSRVQEACALCLHTCLATAVSNNETACSAFQRLLSPFLWGKQGQDASARLRVQILRAGMRCYPAGGASCLSAEYAWQQLMPDFAALVRSLCVAVEAWPPQVPKPKLFTDPGKANLHAPLGLQYMVCSSLLTCYARVRAICLESGVRMEMVLARVCTSHQAAGPTLLRYLCCST